MSIQIAILAITLGTMIALVAALALDMERDHARRSQQEEWYC